MKKGEKHTKKTRMKISLLQKGQHRSPRTEFKKGHISWCKGTKGLVKPNKGSFKKGHKPPEGKEHPNWKGGIWKKRRQWSKIILKRDNYECCGCLKKTKVTHHIITQKEDSNQKYDIRNGLTLCRSCHAYIHKVMEKNGY